MKNCISNLSLACFALSLAPFGSAFADGFPSTIAVRGGISAKECMNGAPPCTYPDPILSPLTVSVSHEDATANYPSYSFGIANIPDQIIDGKRAYATFTLTKVDGKDEGELIMSIGMSTGETSDAKQLCFGAATRKFKSSVPQSGDDVEAIITCLLSDRSITIRAQGMIQ